MSAPEQSAEQRELSLVGKVELRIALADTDVKLSGILKTFLTPLLLKLASEHQSVRNKVVSICQHITTRVQPASVQLPVAALVKQIKEQENSLVRHFDILYVQHGVPRLSSLEKAELLPLVVKDIAKSGSQGPQIFNLLLRLLEAFVIPPRGSEDDLQLRSKLQVSDDDVVYLANHLGEFILFNPSRGGSTVSPGLTPEKHAFFTLRGKEDVWNPSTGGLNLPRAKTLAAKFLASGLFNDEERFLPALFASADPASSISDVGDDMLKRALPSKDLEHEPTIRRLYSLYFGESEAPRVKAPLRMKILSLLAKSTVSTTFANEIMKIVDDGIASPVQDGEDVIMANNSTQNANIGREASKLRAAVFSYVNFVVRRGAQDTLRAIAPHVIARLRDFVENQGWPKPGPNEDLVSRGYAYEVIGLLAKAGPRNVLIEDDRPTIDLLRWQFNSLAKDSSGNSIIVSIEESLSTTLNAISRLDLAAHEQQALEDLLTDQMYQSADLESHKRLRSTRYASVRFANRCLPYDSVKARWIDALAMGAVSDRPEVREEGERGLSPYWHHMLNGFNIGSSQAKVTFPAFEDVVKQFFVTQSHVTSTDASTLVQRVRDQHGTSFPVLTSYARRVLFSRGLEEASLSTTMDSEWERKLDVTVETDLDARNVVKTTLESVAKTTPAMLDIVVCALLECITSNTSASESNLVEFLALAPESLISRHVSRSTSLLPTLKSNDSTRRSTAAEAFGILASHADNIAADIDVKQLIDTCKSWKSAVGAGLSPVHGAVVALGYYYSRLACRQQNTPQTDQFRTYMEVLFDIFGNARDELLIEATHVAIGQMCTFQCLTTDLVDRFSKMRIVSDRLYSKAKDGNESAILCLGQLTMILPEVEGDDDSELTHITAQMHKLHELRQAEAHFTVGESLSYLASGWKSAALATKMDINAAIPTKPARSKTLSELVKKTLSDCANTKPSLKKAAVIWLLCLVQFCGALPELQGRLAECQAAFRRCLSDRDELVQETASRGLGLVYEKGDRHLKDDLVRELVSSFSSDKQQLSGNVSADTQLFEPGALPTGDGSVSTYKDIMSLASEVGDSSLVYRFMSMASSNAIWSSRAAFGRFGLSRVLSDSSVDGYLASNPKLYPKLFRYRFDPNGGVQRSMNEIWNALVPDSTATIEKHFEAIMEEMLTSILGKEWRVRQACCAAIADLVQGRPLEKYEQYLERIWNQCFRVLDDIKESVRAAAASLARTLTGVLTRALEADHSATKNASAMLKHVLPFLLSPSGMESSAQDVQLFAVHTLLEIIKKANGATIRPFIPELVERLIGLLSSLEPEAVNYIHLNASKYNLTEQKIDDMRLSSVRSSPLMEAIERCLDLLDEHTMQALMPKLENAMKTAVGLPSKVGSSRVLVSLSTRRMVLFKPFADHALKIVEKLVVDRNETVSSSYAAAAGYVVRGASEQQTQRLISFAKKLYFESEGDREAATPRRSITSGEIMYAFAKHASDKFSAFAASGLPFVFVAKHDSNEQVKERFQESWSESVGGTRAVQLYLDEILKLCATHLDSPQWTLKHTAARTVADATIVVATGETDMTIASAQLLWPAIEKALSGKTWEGKEVVLSAFVKFAQTAKMFYMQKPDIRAAIVKIAIREAKRQNDNYRLHSVKALGQIALARDDTDLTDAIFDIAEPLIADGDDEDAMEVDSKDQSEARKAEELREATLAGAVEALFSSINAQACEGTALERHVSRVMHVVASLKSEAQEIRRAIYGGLSSAVDRIGERGRKLGNEAALVSDLKSVLFGPTINVEAIRLLRAEAVFGVFKTSPSSLSGEMRMEVEELKAKEPSKAVRDRLEAAIRAAATWTENSEA